MNSGDENARRAAFGGAAIAAGTPDFGHNDLLTDAGDAIANILLHLALALKVPDDVDEAVKLDLQESYALSALDKAQLHFRPELRHLDD